MLETNTIKQFKHTWYYSLRTSSGLKTLQ